MIKRFLQFFKNNEEATEWPSADPSVMQVTPDASRCVQCGLCGFNCPVGIEVREYAHRGEIVTDSRCIGCGVCIARCPRGTLRWGPAILVRQDNTLEINPVTLPHTLEFQPRE
jgi:ferredoxin